MSWTRELPKESGFYWLRYEVGDESIYFWDANISVAETPGALVSLTLEDITDWRMEFWPIKLTPPQ